MRLLYAVILLVACAPLGGGQESDAVSKLRSPPSTSIARGIAWLLEVQNEHGTWGCERSGAPSTAITSLSMLALAASGSTPRRGTHREAIDRALKRLLRIQRMDGAITQEDATGMGLLYDHSCATLALAEFSGLQTEPDQIEGLADGLRKAVAYLARRQNRDGGWDAGISGENSDLALTCSAWLALRAAHGAGVAIEGARVEEVEAFVRKCAEPAGGFAQYPNVQGGGGRMFYPTAAGLRILYGMGRGDKSQIERGLQVLLSKKLGDDFGGKVSEWDYCGGFYAVMALLHENGPAWRQWYPRLRDQLIRMQNADGSWTIEYCLCCRAYATSLALLMLQAPNRLLPMLQM